MKMIQVTSYRLIAGAARQRESFAFCARYNHYPCRVYSSSPLLAKDSKSPSPSIPEKATTQNDTTINATTTYTAKQTAQNEINIQDRVKLIPMGNGIVHVLLSRPKKLNSLDLPMFEAIADAASRLKNDSKLSKDLRVVIMSGEGRAFCTGLDAKSVALSGPRSNLNRLLERPSPYGGGGEGFGNLAQDVCILWR